MDVKKVIREATSATIRKNGDMWCVHSKSGKKMGCYPTRKQAEDRLAQVEMFKHMKENK